MRKQRVVVRKKRKRSRIRKARTMLFWLFLAISGAGIVYIAGNIGHSFLFTSPFFQLKRIDVRGASPGKTDEIIRSLPVKEGDNIFSFSTREAAGRLTDVHPEIRQARLVRRFPDRLELTVAYREPLGLVPVGGRMMCIDEENVLFDLPPADRQVETSLPEVAAEDMDEREMLVRFLRCMRGPGRDRLGDIGKVWADVSREIVYMSRDGTKIAWGTVDEDDFELKYKRLVVVREDAERRFRRLRYINMRYWRDGRVLVRPRGISGGEETF